MAYFNHAFCKSFLVTKILQKGDLIQSQELAAGELGVFQGDWGECLNPAVALPVPNKNLLYLAQGSWMKADKVGSHGGYKESVKSKGINPRYITRLWSSDCQDATASTVTVCVDSTCAPCGENLFLRLDVKGSPALRFLNHNAYAIGDSSGSAALNNDLPGICCADGQEYLDPAVALAKAAGMLLEDPIISPFVQQCQGVRAVTISAGGADYLVDATDVATTGGSGSGLTVDITVAAGAIDTAVINQPGSGYTNGDVVTVDGGVGGQLTLIVSDAGITVTVAGVDTFYSIAEILDGTYTPSTDPVADEVSACACFVGAYVDTKFGDCTFDSRDFYEKEPVQLIASILDETGDPCNECGVVTTTPGIMQQTSGETVLRDLLLTERYMQNPYHQGSFDGFRMNEIEGFDTLKAAVDRDALYKTYYIQHSIPRLNNPTGVFDNDQYVYKIYIQCDAGQESDPTTQMDELMNQLATLCQDSYGNPISYENSLDSF